MTDCRIGLEDITLPDLLDVKSLLEVHKICAPLRSIFDEPSGSTPTRQGFIPLLRSDRTGHLVDLEHNRKEFRDRPADSM